MNMKAVVQPVLFFALFTWSFSACDQIPYSEVDEVQPQDTTQNNPDSNSTSLDSSRVVLLEDYTGHTCTNCPKAAKAAEELKDIYGDQLVILAWHVGYFAEPQGGNYALDLRTEQGAELNQRYDIDLAGLPKGMVNRIEDNGKQLFNYSTWGGIVQKELQKEREAAFDVQSALRTGRNIALSLDVHLFKEQSSILETAYYLVENGITGWQRGKDDENKAIDLVDYRFDHTVRGYLSKDTDNSFAPPHTPGTILSEEVDFAIPQTFSVNSLDSTYVVVVLREQANQRVLQAEKIKLNLQ